VVSKYLKASQTVLDWGCGGGHFSYLLMQQNYDVYSYAYSNQDNYQIIKMKIAKEFNKNWNWVLSDGLDPIKVQFKNQFYAGIISVGVLEDVQETGGDEKESLKEMWRLLKPGGFFFCFHFPNRYSWIEAAARTLRRFHIDKFCHSHLYSRQNILDLIS